MVENDEEERERKELMEKERQLKVRIKKLDERKYTGKILPFYLLYFINFSFNHRKSMYFMYFFLF